MSLSNFIPSVWSARILETLNTTHVYTNLMNRDYEGEISALGDTVKINSIGRVTIGTYTKNTDISAAETLTDAQTTLTIDTARYFNFQVDDIDAAQTKPKVMDAAMRDAAWGLADAIDLLIAGLYTQVPAANTQGTNGAPVVGGSLTAGSAMYDLLVNMAVDLDESNVPDDGNRFVVVPAWAHGVMLKDNRFINSTETGNQIRANGFIGKAAGFNVYKSNNVTKSGTASTDSHRIIAGHPMAWSYAEQVSEVEAYRPQLRFGDAVKGLLLCGYKVVRPTALALLYAKTAAS
jgi:hypothetical protein